MTIDTQLARLLILVMWATGVLLAVGPLRRWSVAHPALVLALVVGIDSLLLLWANTPFVVSGFDEAQFLIDAHRLHGADLDVAWIRTPLPVLAVAAVPFHPPLPGIVTKQLVTVLTFLLARRPLGAGSRCSPRCWPASRRNSSPARAKCGPSRSAPRR